MTPGEIALLTAIAGGLGAFGKHLVDGYKAKRAADVELAKTDVQRATREADASVKIATLDANAQEQRDDAMRSLAEYERMERQKAAQKVDELQNLVRELSIKVERVETRAMLAEQRQRACEDRDTEREEKIRQMSIQVDFHRQLSERQKAEIEDLTVRFNRMVRTVMQLEARGSMPPPAGSAE